MNERFEPLTPEQQKSLERFLPIRVVMRRDAEGRFIGVTEESFAMSTSRERVNIFWSGKAYSLLGEHMLDAIEDAERNAKDGDIVIDPLAPDSPIEINWRYWLAAWERKGAKYDQRNAPFFPKD